MTPEVKDTLANGATITALGAALMDWTSVFTFVLIVTGVILNFTRLYDWWKQRDNRQ